MWQDFAAALALVLVIEGIGPFLLPASWREMMARLSGLDDRTLRTAGLMAMVAGLVLLQLLR